MESGDRRGDIHLEPYNPKWRELFASQARDLRAVFREKALAVEHIGSTSIPGMRSKPIIDIVATFSTLDDARGFVSELTQSGFEFSNKESTEERLFFRKGHPTNIQLSLAVHGDWFHRRNLLFRDYLSNHSERAREYEQLKVKLSHEDPSFGRRYTEGKTLFVRNILANAQGERD